MRAWNAASVSGVCSNPCSVLELTVSRGDPGHRVADAVVFIVVAHALCAAMIAHCSTMPALYLGGVHSVHLLCLLD